MCECVCIRVIQFLETSPSDFNFNEVILIYDKLILALIIIKRGNNEFN